MKNLLFISALLLMFGCSQEYQFCDYNVSVYHFGETNDVEFTKVATEIVRFEEHVDYFSIVTVRNGENFVFYEGPVIDSFRINSKYCYHE